MPIKYKVGCLVKAAKEGEIDVIGHCANCFNTMKSGIAPQIARAFPEAWAADQDTDKGCKSKLGHFTWAVSGDVTVFNLYGQYHYSPRTIMHLDYGALLSSLDWAAWFMKKAGDKSIGLPKIGCGLAGGDWNIVLGIIRRTLKDFDVTIYVLDEKEIP